MLADDIYLVFFCVVLSFCRQASDRDRIKERELTNCFVSLCSLMDFEYIMHIGAMCLKVDKSV